MGNGPTVVATISANDEASARLRAIAELATSTAKHLEKMGASNRLTESLRASEQAALANERAFGRMHVALSRALDGAKSFAKQFASNAAMLAGPVILHGLNKGLQGGAEIQSQDLKNVAAGTSPAERANADELAAKLAFQYHNLDTAELVKLFRETRGVLQNKAEVPEMMPVIAQAESALRAGGGNAEGLPFALKGAELLGYASSPEKLQKYLDGFIKAQQTLGEFVTPESVYEFAKYSKAAGARFSERFASSVGPTLAQDMGGSTAGNDLAMFETFMQTMNNHAGAKAMVALGLAKDSDFEHLKNGEIKGLKLGHTIDDAKLAASDPDLYIKDKLIPALIAHGYDTKEKQLAALPSIFHNRSALDLVTKFIQQESTFASHLDALEKAMGLAATSLERDSATLALGTVETGLENLASVFTNPAMPAFAFGLSKIADGLAWATLHLSDWNKRFPTAAAALSVLGTSIVGVTGAVSSWKLAMGLLGQGAGARLTGSALALDGSAAALDRAALALSGAGAIPKGAAAAGGAAIAEGAAVATGAEAAPGVVRSGGWLAELLGLPGLGSTGIGAAVGASAEVLARLAGPVAIATTLAELLYDSDHTPGYGLQGPSGEPSFPNDPSGRAGYPLLLDQALDRSYADERAARLDPEAHHAAGLHNIGNGDAPFVVATDLKGTVDGHADINVHISMDDIIGGLKREVSAILNLRGDLGTSRVVPAPRNATGDPRGELH